MMVRRGRIESCFSNWEVVCTASEWNVDGELGELINMLDYVV
jgi:hypothetical protein